MLLEKTGNFETFLKESFHNDIVKRELRLSDRELEMVKQIFPNAKVTKLPTSGELDGKLWYEVNIAG